jgi:peptidoglycan hydrolase-like protein with peptidoglycan-binding domain
MSANLTVGSRGDDVTKLQQDLNVLLGEKLKVDGSYGVLTAGAVQRARKKLALPISGDADGIFLRRLALTRKARVTPAAPAGTPITLLNIHADAITRAIAQTVMWEGRRDNAGNLKVYKLPAADGGGTFEVAGINDKYHPEAAVKLRDMKPADRMAYAVEYIANYVRRDALKYPTALQPYVADIIFNRGAGGCAKYAQESLNALGYDPVTVDGDLGTKSQAALASIPAEDLVNFAVAMADAQLRHELRLADKNAERADFLPGLLNRVNQRLQVLAGYDGSRSYDMVA